MAETIPTEDIIEETPEESITLPTTTTKWDFTGSDVSVSFSPSGTAKGAYNNIYVDASSTGAKLEYRTESKDVQANVGTVLYIPTKPGYDLVFTAYKTSGIVVGETLLTAEDSANWSTFTYTNTNTTDKIVTVTFTSQTYIRTIELVEHVGEVVDDTTYKYKLSASYSKHTAHNAKVIARLTKLGVSYTTDSEGNMILGQYETKKEGQPLKLKLLGKGLKPHLYEV